MLAQVDKSPEGQFIQLMALPRTLQQRITKLVDPPGKNRDVEEILLQVAQDPDCGAVVQQGLEQLFVYFIDLRVSDIVALLCFLSFKSVMQSGTFFFKSAFRITTIMFFSQSNKMLTLQYCFSFYSQGYPLL